MIIVKGLVVVGGSFDTGKSSFALGVPGIKPEKILFFNSDVRDVNTLDELGVKHINLVNIAESKKLELAFHEEVMKIIDGIKPNQYDCIVFDTYTSFADTFHAYVVKNKKKYSSEWHGTAQIVGGRLWKQVRRHEQFVINKLLSKAGIVILTAHLKNHYVNQHKSELMVPAFSPAITKAAVLKLWLRKNPNSPVPLALVEKRLSTRFYNEDTERIETISVLPQKLVPLENETSLWDSIARYQVAPIGLREPIDSEKLTEQEILDMAGVLSDDDKRTLMIMIENKPHEDESVVTLADEAKTLDKEGLSHMEIAKQLDLTLPEIKELLQ